MTNTDRETETATSVEQLAEMPLPTDPKVIFLGGLFVLALLATAYVLRHGRETAGCACSGGQG
jgi:hypothetical protein